MTFITHDDNAIDVWNYRKVLRVENVSIR